MTDEPMYSNRSATGIIVVFIISLLCFLFLIYIGHSCGYKKGIKSKQQIEYKAGYDDGFQTAFDSIHYNK